MPEPWTPEVQPWMDPVLSAKVLLNEMRMERVDAQIANGALDRLATLGGMDARELARRAADEQMTDLGDDDEVFHSVVGPTLSAALGLPAGEYSYDHYAQPPNGSRREGVTRFLNGRRTQILGMGPLAPVVLLVAFGIGVLSSITATLIMENRDWVATQFKRLQPDGSWKPTGERPPVLYERTTGRTFHRQADGTYRPEAGPVRV